MVGMSLIRLTYLKENGDRISWFPPLTIVAAMWIVAPAVTTGFSILVYAAVRRMLSAQRSRADYLVFMPFVCGAIFVVCSSFFFCTQTFENFALKTKLYACAVTGRIFIPSLIAGSFLLGMMFKRFHFFTFKYTPSMSPFRIFLYTVLILYFLLKSKATTIPSTSTRKKWMRLLKPTTCKTMC